ncbi:AMP-binding protein [Nocardioides zeae]|uniref:Phenylacetate-coenzyme A ligase PaaK-like adenylate-forming protein n=1 Tax=Nocardioides zeae TaxID=1457234 RepID=A0AAJ1WZR6_9ACTN|nr:AMP-binding protein [Nocardioides zeae]MDQ1102996.1 phenylacetate-coenzyme A ligase PaaK-like adenylate-forming protein [Nocardioides zeae]
MSAATHGAGGLHPLLELEASVSLDRAAGSGGALEATVTGPDPHEFLAAALDWHFSPATGSPLWLDLARGLDFDPRRDVRSWADLARFPDIAGALRDRPVEDLLPRGLQGGPVPSVFETGGTTGAPKRLLYTPGWVERVLRWKVAELRAAGFPEGGGWLVAMPSGPHAYGHTARLQARELGSVLFTVDLDPRWVRKAIAAGSDPRGYVGHLVQQVRHVVTSQRVRALTTTPPILAELLLDDEVAQRLAEVEYVALAGAHLDQDTYELLTEALPTAVVQNIYGSTMVLTTARLRDPAAPPADAVYDGYPPFVSFSVVDPQTGEPVAAGERGQVRMAHVSSGVFIPNNLERDSAVRVPGLRPEISDALAQPAPLASFEGEQVVQGVY